MKKLVCLIVGAMGVMPSLALGHAHLERSTPGNNSVLQIAPQEVTLTFSEPVALISLVLKKEGADTERALSPLPLASSVHIVVPLPRLEDGVYTLVYKAEGGDLHEAAGNFQFKVTTGTHSTSDEHQPQP